MLDLQLLSVLVLALYKGQKLVSVFESVFNGSYACPVTCVHLFFVVLVRKIEESV